MIDLVPPMTNLAVFVLGALTGKAFTMWEINRTAARLEAAGSTTPIKLRGIPVILSVLVVSFLLLAAFGFQQRQFQRDADTRDACVAQWGRDMVDTVEKRSESASEVTKARARRDAAIDAVLLVAANAVPNPTPEQQEAARAEFRKTLREFVEARAKLEAAVAGSTATQEANPYPELSCG